MCNKHIPEPPFIVENYVSPFLTQAVTNDSAEEPVTKEAIPSDLAIDEAKDWVDSNEL